MLERYILTAWALLHTVLQAYLLHVFPCRCELRFLVLHRRLQLLFLVLQQLLQLLPPCIASWRFTLLCPLAGYLGAEKAAIFQLASLRSWVRGWGGVGWAVE